ncbi:MAG: PBSX family phage terminase large subunit [Clostridia bacterium]
MSNSTYYPFSQKQLATLTWWNEKSPYHSYDAIICDGAVRSGKTMCMSLSFVAWAFYEFDDTSFAICGKTIASLKRNVITTLMPVLGELGFDCKHKLSQNLIEISMMGKTNRFYLFGGRDESSASLIQGMTLGGVLLDEVALMPRSFVEQALARCSLSGSKFWFNCNPENPMHWFYENWIKKADEKNCLYLHFLMHDNPALTKKIIKRYTSLYSGAFYERFVLGRWVAVDGLIYPELANGKYISPPPVGVGSKYYISCDYGTVNPTSYGLWALFDDVWYRVDEYYYNSREVGRQKTDEEYYEALTEFANGLNIEAIIVDPSAASFMECIRRHKKFKVIAAKNDVVDGIHKVHEAFKQGKLIICPNCKSTIKEFSLYRWDTSSVKDTPKKEYDHAMDEMRYFVATVLAKQDSGFFAISMSRT